MTTTMNTCSRRLLLLAVAAAAVVVSTSAVVPPPTADPDPYPCPWRTVPDPEDPFIQKLGKWAVQQLHVVMRFDKVVRAKLQGIGSCNTLTRDYYYELIIAAALRGPNEYDNDYHYRAVVYVTNFTQPQKVMSFQITAPYRPGPPQDD
ncbi:hypothetical protein BDA96_08G052600 [Sorghum bicolor]|uniref:Cystatin domain-containing protein n=1 Tax=Sorghum bicolor TaxID=4558 RepID=A0A921U6N8_SORBI|nr:hypothetical protein BDA96_08G052600 [Sorghum bicolor]